VDGSAMPSVRHPNGLEAEAEAERLAKKFGKRVWVLSAAEFVEPQVVPLKWTTV